MKRLITTVFCASALVSVQAFGACGVDDGNFATTDGGCKDLATGLVWSSDFKSVNDNFGTSQASLEENCPDRLLGQQVSAEPYGFNDWRLPTLPEVQQSLANGLASHLDFYYDEGFQGPADEVGVVGADNGRYRWTATRVKIRGTWHNQIIRYADGDSFPAYQQAGSSVICVRGVPSDEGGGPGNGKGGGKKNTLSQATTSALLMTPLAFVLASCGMRRRWS